MPLQEIRKKTVNKNRMKKTTTLLCLGIAFCLAACSDDDNKVTMPEAAPTHPFSATASLPVRSTDSSEGVHTLNGMWNENAKLAVLRLVTSKTPKAVISKNATSPDQFTGEISTQVYNDNELALFYPAEALTMSSSDTLAQELYLNGQDGTLANVTQYDYVWAKAKASVQDQTVSTACEMTPLMSIGKFQFAVNGTPLNNIARITVTATSGELYSSATLQLKTGQLINPRKGILTVNKPTEASNETYISFFPGKAQLHFTLVTNDQRIYETTTTEEIQLEKGKIYTSPTLACTPMQPARIGDYYYSDATYSTMKDANKTCIGIVFALDDANGQLLTQQETSPYGRIVALRDNQYRVKWTSKPNDMEGIANETMVNGQLEQGALPYYQGTVESYFTDKAEEQIHGVTIDVHSGQITAWAQQGALSDFAGKSHTACFNHNTSTFPAGGLCSQYTTDGTAAGYWYLPAAGELALLWELYKSGVICEDSKDEFHNFAQKGYWSSSEHSEGKAWYINFISGFLVANSKSSVYATRPVARF